MSSEDRPSLDIKIAVGIFTLVLFYFSLITIAVADEYKCSVIWSSGAYSGSGDSIGDAIDDARENCHRVDPEFVNMPNIFRVNFQKNELRSSERSTTIQHVTKNKSDIIAQGTSENGRGWSILLDKSSGKFTGAIAAHEYGFIMFGSCVID